MAKKTKLRKKLTAALVAGSLIAGIGGGAAWYVWRNNIRPPRIMNEGRALFKKGDYIAAGNMLSRMGDRMATDPEFLTMFYETLNRQTSYRDLGFRDARGRLDTTLASLPRNVQLLTEYLKLEFSITDAFGIDKLGPEDVRRIADASDKILQAEPANPAGLRAVALVKVVPLFQPNSTLTSDDVQKTVEELRTMADASPTHPDILFYYAFANARLRDTLTRERALPEKGESPRLKAIFDDLNARVEALLAFAADESKPADERGRAYARSRLADQVVLASRLIDDKDALAKVVERRKASLASAASLLTSDSDLYLQTRFEHANTFVDAGKFAEAEAVLRDTVAADPIDWDPRLALAEFLAERDRAPEALEALNVELKPNTELKGLRGRAFFETNRQMPMRRALFRLQALAKLKPEQREPEIAKAQAEYDNAIATNTGNNFEASPFSLQVKAALQEIRNDRSGAVQTLNRALESMPADRPDRLSLRIMRQLVVLNLSINQPGAASTMLERIQRATGGDIQSVLQLIDLRIKNNDMEGARALVELTKARLPNNPVLTIYEIRTMTDPVKQKAALSKIPEDIRQIKLVKLQYAGELDDEPTVRRIGDEMLKAEPGVPDVTMAYAQYLRKHNARDEALTMLKASLEKNPDNQYVAILVKDTETTDRSEILKDLIKDPVQLALAQADQARAASDLATYKAKLLEAEAADKDNRGDATERLFAYYLATKDLPAAEAALNKLASSSRDPAQVRTLRVRLAMAKGNVDEASSLADALIADLPAYGPGWAAKGQTHQARGQYDQAITAYQTALTSQPENIDALHGLVETGARAGRQDVIQRAIETGLRVTKNDEYFTDQSLRYQLAYGDPSQTIAPRLKMRDAHPDDPGAWLALAQAYAVSAADREKKNDAPGAADLKKKTLQLFREGMAKFPDLAGFAFEAANQMYLSGDKEGALKLVDGMNANAKFASNVNVQAQRVDFYTQHDKVDVAQSLLTEIVKSGQANDQMKTSLASMQAQQGKADDALATLADVKDAPQIREMKMNILLAANRADEASKLVNDALTKERTVPNLLMAALVLGSQNKEPDALKLADEAVTKEPDNSAARYTRAGFLLREKPVRNNDVISDLQVVRKNQPGNFNARLILAERLQTVQRSAEALQELESLQREMPGNLEAALTLIRTYAAERPMRMGRIDQVFVDAKKQGLENDAKLLSLESLVATQNKDWSRAIKSAQKAAEGNPQDVGLIRALLGTLINAGANKEVIGELDKIEASNGSLYWTYLTRGIALHRLKRDEQAAPQFDRAMSIASSLKDSGPAIGEIATSYSTEYGAEAAATWLKGKLPDTAETQLMLMRLLMGGGKLDKAISAGEQLMPSLDQLPLRTQTQVLSSLGTAYLGVNPPKPAKARAAFTKLDQLEPDNMMTLNNLAYSMTLEGSGATIQQALEIAKKANDLSIKNSTPNVYIMDTYGWTLIQATQIDEGIRVLRQAAELERIPEVDYHLGEALIVKQQKDEALQTLQNGLANLNKLKQNGQAVDPSLEARINDAIHRADLVVPAP